MSRTVLNPALLQISGHIGGLVFRHQPDGTITLAHISLPRRNRVPSPAQAAHLERFRQAAAHCQYLLLDPDTKAAYEQLLAARGPMGRLNALVMGDSMKPPIIRTLDLSAYRSAGIIRVLAEDNVAVARLTLAIYDQTTGQDVETAENVFAIDHLAPRVEWLATTKTPAPAGHALEVRVSVYDLAGNQAETCQAI